MKLNIYSLFIVGISSLVLLSGCGSDDSLTIYSGRSKALVEDVVKQFENETDIKVNVRYGSSTQLSMALMEEGARTPADLFWAQDAGALGAIQRAGMLTRLPDEMFEKVPPEFRSSEGNWIATSGRARVLAYSKPRVDENRLPSSIFELTDDEWAGRVGWAPGNASFQAFLTAMRITEGEERTREWVEAMKTNNTGSYTNNNALIQAISAGEIDLALTNHYYLFRYLDTNKDYPVAQTFFRDGDPGNLINIAGIGILENSQNQQAALKFASFLLREETQNWFVDETFEYPVVNGVDRMPGEVNIENVRLVNPELNLNDLEDLNTTLQMLREVGLL